MKKWKKTQTEVTYRMDTGRKLYVITGHGNGDSGAVGGGYKEADLVRELAVKIKELGGDMVVLGDMNKNYYASNEISKLDLKGYQLLELHMDSATSSARGGHVIINSTFEPDKYDIALAENISRIFPGRSNTIVKRSDLANPKRAAVKGYPYRLLEVCFISNDEDRGYFLSHLDEIATAILSAFGINVVNNDNGNAGNENNNNGVEMTEAQEVWNVVFPKKSDSTFMMSTGDLLGWTEFNTAYLYSMFSNTTSSAGDGTFGTAYDRICWIDYRCREAEKNIEEINKKLDIIIEKLS